MRVKLTEQQFKEYIRYQIMKESVLRPEDYEKINSLSGQEKTRVHNELFSQRCREMRQEKMDNLFSHLSELGINVDLLDEQKRFIISKLYKRGTLTDNNVVEYFNKGINIITPELLNNKLNEYGGVNLGKALNTVINSQNCSLESFEDALKSINKKWNNTSLPSGLWYNGGDSEMGDH